MTEGPDEQIRALQEQLRAAQEVIEALSARMARDAQHRDPDALPLHKAIASLENTVELRTRELARSEAHYRALFDHGPNLAFIIDDLGIITSANAIAARLLDGELLGMPLIELFEGSARDVVEDLLTADAGEADEIEMVGGRVVDITVAPVPGFGHTQVIVRDVSARVELGRQLQHARRLAAIGDLAAGVAHEINNPLAVLQLGLTDLSQRVPDAARAAIDELLGHTRRIARIVTNLRAFAAPETPERTRVEVLGVVEAARQLAGVSGEPLELTCTVESPTLSVIADRAQLELVMVNLLGNSARAIAGGGTIEVRARAVDQRVLIQILDEGPPIPDDVLEQMFTPFVSGGGERVGTGLGLAISWGLMQDNEGCVRAFNRAEGGVCFELELPLAPALEPPAPAHPPDEPPKLRILCVEDEPSLLRSLVRLLGLSGHVAVGVETAELGLELLASEPFDLVISDVRLPGMSGDELRRLVLERYPALRKRVLLMSGYFPEREDASPFLQKPFSLRQLTAAIEAILAD
ncbi:hybrid sensor histidine kinase/response regulator [Enhygromyxa salina]|uniref:histidine kinase n=1 Tax=Enhygromyxa salina TaxID=215803 RepID=A0A2S9YPS9_9BACT|nr:ATP-binding protein [Enhygromyxa salina]PRQ07096.1 Sporulation kinase A [Enhygromyxa salina]